MTTVSATRKTSGMANPAIPAATPAWFAALLLGNFVLAIGPFFVRSADCGPVSAGFWRMVVALPVHLVLARRQRQPVFGHGRAVMIGLVIAGIVFGLDIAAWHLGIGRTHLGNATLFGNSGSVFLMAWGLIAAHRAPRWSEAAAIGCALGGAAILLGRSLQFSQATLTGDLFCIAAGVFYFSYFVCLSGVQRQVGNWPMVFWTGVFSAPVLLATAIALNEPVWPHVWWPVVALGLCSQVVGQGLLVAALKRFSPLVIGLTLLCQPAVAVLQGLWIYGETPGAPDLAGMALVAVALVFARIG